MSDFKNAGSLIVYATSLLRELISASQLIHSSQAEGRDVTTAELRAVKDERAAARLELVEAIEQAEAEGR